MCARVWGFYQKRGKNISVLIVVTEVWAFAWRLTAAWRSLQDTATEKILIRITECVVATRTLKREDQKTEFISLKSGLLLLLMMAIIWYGIVSLRSEYNPYTSQYLCVLYKSIRDVALFRIYSYIYIYISTSLFFSLSHSHSHVLLKTEAGEIIISIHIITNYLPNKSIIQFRMFFPSEHSN